MLIPEPGVHQTSERYFFTPSSLARELFYYPTRCGHYFCDSRYSFSHRSEIALEGDHNRNIMLFESSKEFTVPETGLIRIVIKQSRWVPVLRSIQLYAA